MSIPQDVRWGDSGAPGPVALVGSGEYLPVMSAVDRRLLDGRPPVYVQVPTAAAPEGADRLRHWLDLGEAHARRLGVTARPLAVTTAADTEQAGFAADVRGAGLIYFSGGNPTYLAETLRGSHLWCAMEKEWRAGAALAGCSAGAMALTSWVPSVRRPERGPVAGLNVVPHLRVIPHFDRFAQWFPDLADRYLADLPAGVSVIGIDEDTAMVGGPDHWDVMGRQSCWTLTPSGRTEHPSGSVLHTPTR